jgi:hypothetical protein
MLVAGRTVDARANNLFALVENEDRASPLRRAEASLRSSVQRIDAQPQPNSPCVSDSRTPRSNPNRGDRKSRVQAEYGVSIPAPCARAASHHGSTAPMPPSYRTFSRSHTSNPNWETARSQVALVERQGSRVSECPKRDACQKLSVECSICRVHRMLLDHARRQNHLRLSVGLVDK